MATPERSGESVKFTFKWSKEQTEAFITLRKKHDVLFTGAKNSAAVGWSTILEEMGLQQQVTPTQAKKKWDNLKKKYKDCKDPGTGEGVDGKATAGTWPWFVLMDEFLGQRPSINPPVLIASIQEDEPGPSAAGAQQVEEEEDEAEAEEEEEEEGRPSRKRRRRGEDDLLTVIKEDMRLQREAEERRAEESRRNMDRLFSLLERMIDRP